MCDVAILAIQQCNNVTIQQYSNPLKNYISHLSKDKKLKNLIEAQQPYVLSVQKKSVPARYVLPFLASN